MKIILLVSLIVFVITELDYPYSCDCQEHDNSDTCVAHQCIWNETEIGTKKCRVKGCSERDNDVAGCVAPSQFYSTNRTSCYPQGIQTQTCQPISSCEELDVSKISPSYARRVCKVNFCGYNTTSKICKTVNKCSDATTETECNNLFINELPTLFSPVAYCYWAGDVCMTATRFFGDCTDKNLGNQNLCKAHGCQWKNSECVNLNCTTSTTTLCAKEQINSFGNVLICELANSLCVETNSTSIKKENCDKMTAHTFDTAAQLCKPQKGCEYNNVIPSLTYNNSDFIFIMIINFMQNIKKSKYRIKDVIDGKTQNDEKSAQKFVQLSHIKKNVSDFLQLKQTLQDRKVTFAKFAFRQQELIDDKKLGPVLKGICIRTRIGSMSVTELVPKFELYKYLKQAHLESSKRVLRRYAHWEWDQEQQEKKEEPPSYKFTSKTEFEYKKKLETKDAEKQLRKQIIKKWAQSLPDVAGLTSFGKQFTMQSSPLRSTKATFSKTHTSINFHPRSESTTVSNWITELDALRSDNQKIRMKLKGTIQSIQNIIEKQEQKKNAQYEINGE